MVGPMRVFFAIFSALSFFLAVAPLGAERIKIATYNIENYTSTDRRVEGVYRTAYPKPENEKTALRAVLHALDADVLILQEMGSLKYLEELQHDLRREGLDYPFAQLCEGRDPDRHLAMLSRRPFRSARAHTELRFPYFGKSETVKRGALELHFPIGKKELTLVSVHLKSRFTDRSDDPDSTLRRTAESKAVRDEMLQFCPNWSESLLLVLGDFNDVPKSRAVQLWQNKGKTKLLEVLPAVDSRGESWTHHYLKEDSYSRIDYLMVSPALHRALVEEPARIGDGPETLVASDHRPLFATFEID